MKNTKLENNNQEHWQYSKRIKLYYPFRKCFPHAMDLIKEGFSLKSDFEKGTKIKTQDQKFTYFVEKYFPRKHLVVSTVVRDDKYTTSYNFGEWGQDSYLIYTEEIHFVWKTQKSGFQKFILKHKWLWKVRGKAKSIRQKIEKRMVRELDQEYKISHFSKK